jgi:hypothetical protein
MQSKTHLELATELVTVMVSKGQIRIPTIKDEDSKAHNHKAIHTVGWAILEVYRELQGVRDKAKENPETKRALNRIVLAG